LIWLNLRDNQITSIENGYFNGLSSLERLDLDSNQITSIESGDFDGLSSLNSMNLNYNCINIQDIIILNYLSTLSGSIIYYDTQYVCVDIQYSPSTTTTGSVTGSLIFR
jgi:Leucine-rich repeat (LRR) protein